MDKMEKEIAKIKNKNKKLTYKAKNITSEALYLEKIGDDLKVLGNAHEKIIGQHILKLATALEHELPVDKRPTKTEIGMAIDLPFGLDGYHLN